MLSSNAQGREVITISIPNDAAFVEGKHFQQGTNAAPDGTTLTLNNHFLRLGDAPFYPIAGEIHYSRYPRAEWEEAILKMKAGGIRVVAFYCFWNHHEETKGHIRFDDNRDVRHFIKLCAKHDMYAYPRIGPWCHGEARYGGFPDWFIHEFGEEREAVWEQNGPHWNCYERLYQALAEQFKGLYFRDGGPIIAIQLDNEVPAENADAAGYRYMSALKQLALRCGIDAPLYTVTGWGGVVPEDDVIPTWGAYPEAPWEQHSNELPPSDNYCFFNRRWVPGIGTDLGLNAMASDDQTDLVSRHPFLTVEMGGGQQITYHRRPVVTAKDVLGPVYTRVGMGANSMGYYVFHGSQHPLSDDLSYPTQESRATHYLNDYPMISYDFQAPLSEWGFPRAYLNDFRLMHMFLTDFAPVLAPMTSTLADYAPDVANTEKLRHAVRSRSGSGFLFINNYVRHLPMAEHKNVQFTLELPGERLTIPAQGGLDIADGVYTAIAFNLKLGQAHLKYSTAHPFCILNNDRITYCFYAVEGIAPEYQFTAESLRDLTVRGGEVIETDGIVTVGAMQPGRDCIIRLHDVSGREIEIVTLREEDALHACKATFSGTDCLLLSDRLLLTPGGADLEIRSFGKARFELAVYPQMNIAGAGCRQHGTTGIFTQYEIETPAWDEKKPTVALKTDMAAFAAHCASLKQTPLGPTYGHQSDPQTPDLVYEIQWPENILDGVNDIKVEFDYRGNTAQIYAGDYIIADDYYIGVPMPFGLRRHADKIGKATFRLQLSPLLADHKNIYFEPGIDLEFAKTTHAELREVSLTPEYRVLLTVK